MTYRRSCIEEVENLKADQRRGGEIKQEPTRSLPHLHVGVDITETEGEAAAVFGVDDIGNHS